MNFREVIGFIKSELSGFYPDQEIDAMYRIIFSCLLGFSQYDLIVRATDIIPEKTELQIYDIIQQLKGGKPIQYILGETEFYGLKFKVDQRVLIPRPETEELVDWIIKDSKSFSNPKILDIGTGSGCIAISLAKFIQNSDVSALDISNEAMYIARENGNINGVSINYIKHDILHPNISGDIKYNIIVSNPPYVTLQQKDMMHKNVLDYEPEIALFTPDDDPLLFYKAITKFASIHLTGNGLLYFEINEDLGKETLKIMRGYGFDAEIRKDINEKDRMIKAWRNE